MSYPTNYAQDVLKNYPFPEESADLLGRHTRRERVCDLKQILNHLEAHGYVVTRVDAPLEGAIGSVKIRALGKSAAEVEMTLLSYGTRCDSAAEASECSYGEMVIERNLQVPYGESGSWQGRLTIYPTLGALPEHGRKLD